MPRSWRRARRWCLVQTAGELKDAVRRYINEHYKEPVRLDDFCDRHRLDRRRVQRMLSNSGTSWRTELIEQRMKEAKKLLRQTAMSVRSVAQEVGYPSSAHFSKEFRKHNDDGLSPLQYRAAARKAQR